MQYKDRTTGLIIFGILTILLGLFLGLMGGFMLFSQTLVPQAQRLDTWALVPAIGIYEVLGIILVILGIGSAMTRRWARALLLIFSWTWLSVGVFEMIGIAIMLPMTLSHLAANSAMGHHGPTSPVAIGIIMLVTMGILGFFFILLPGVWTFFYYSPHVKATCDARYPHPSWTDACPLPVLALSLWMWICTPMMLVSPLTGHLVIPLFGALLVGLPAGALCLGLAAVWGTAGWLCYRVNLGGWWLAVITIVLSSVSSIITFSIHDMMDFYRLANYPPAQLDVLQKSGMFSGHAFVWIMVVALLPFLGYLLWVRRYFFAPAVSM